MKSITRFFLVITTAAAMQIGLAPVYAEVAPSSASSAAQQSEVEMQAVNINTAPAEHIAEVLTGVGLKKAQAIVAWREQHGSFSSVEQLTEVKGIGDNLLDKNRDRIVIN